MTDTRTRAQQNRAIRQEELRDKLAAGGHLQHAIDSIEKLNDAVDDFQVRKHKAVFDAHCKLLSKYLPDLKATEITGDAGGPLDIGEIIFKSVKCEASK